jgi:hypothetical protein
MLKLLFNRGVRGARGESAFSTLDEEGMGVPVMGIVIKA